MSASRHLWLAGGASVIGAAHERRGLPNQDAAYWSPSSRPDDRFVLAVADGHGGPAYPRSAHGASFALDALRELLEWFFDEPEQLERLPSDLVEVWRRRVREHLTAHPPEWSTAPSFAAYGTTLVAVAGTPNSCLVAQIGDGDLMLGYADGRIERPLASDPHVVGEQTYSLGMDNAAEFVKYRLLDNTHESLWPDFALVATDGVSKSFVDDVSFEQVVRNYRDLVETEADLAATLGALPEWLREVSERGSGDDVSLCMATRRHIGR